MNEQAEQALALAGFPGPLMKAVGNALAYIDHLRGIRDEQSAKLRRHLDEIAELQDRAGLAEGREAAAKANAEQMAGWLDARNAGLVQMAGERDALREKLAAAEAKAARVKAPTAKVCRCVNTTYAFDPARAVVLPLAGYSITAGVGCPSCGGSGAVIVETGSGG